MESTFSHTDTSRSGSENRAPSPRPVCKRVRSVLHASVPSDLRRRSQSVALPTAREWIEFLTYKFLLSAFLQFCVPYLIAADNGTRNKQYQRLLGQRPGSLKSSQDLERPSPIREVFNELHGIYTARVPEPVRVRSRIDFLRRCISALCTRSVGRRSVLANLHILEAAVWELDEREVEEQETLEGVREVALGVISLG